MGNDVFLSTKIKNLTLPKNVRELSDANSFDTIDTLENLFVVDDNPYYVSIDGVMYTKDMSTLYLIPKRKNISYFSVPYGVKTIATGAMQNIYISVLVISETVRTCGAYFGRYSQIQYMIFKQKPGQIVFSTTQYFQSAKYTPILDYMSEIVPTCNHQEIILRKFSYQFIFVFILI